MTKTKAQKGYDKVLYLLSRHERDDILLECMAILDSPDYWDSSTIEMIAERFTSRGFIIRDPNDPSQYEPSELEE